MEVTSSSPHGVMSLSSYFDVSPTGFPWRSSRLDQIRERRAALDDKLIFDILLASGGIQDPVSLYPPREPQGLERLLDAIQSSTYDTLKKHTLIYFLLKWHQDGREDRFKIQFSIPPQFSALADAYWYLDSGISIPKAVSILSDSRLNRDYASKIIRAIELSPQPGPLILNYVRTAKPPLVEPPDLLIYLVALADSSVFEAWQFQRSFSETDEMRARLFKRILDWAIFPNMQPDALKDLISLPLSNYEQNLLNEHALKPPSDYDPTAISIIQDLVCVRYIQHGKYIEAIKLDRKFTAAGFDDSDNTTSTSNANRRRSGGDNTGGGVDSNERKQMIRQLYESLSPVEKSLLDTEFHPSRREPQQPAGVGASAPTHAITASGPAAAPPAAAEAQAPNDVSMSQSWEEVTVPENLNKSTSTPLKNIQIPPSTGAAPSQLAFSVPISTSATAAANNAPSGAAPAAAAPAPILPLSSSTSSKPLPAPNGFTPRKSLPLSSLGKGRPAFSGAGQRLSLGGTAPGITISSPASGIGIKFPVGSNKPVPASGKQAAGKPLEQPKFVKTVDRENAFYIPPKPQRKGENTLLEKELHRLKEDGDDESGSDGEEEKEELAKGKGKEKEKEEFGGDEREEREEGEEEKEKEERGEKEDMVPGWKDADDIRELNRSVFGNGTAKQQPVAPPPPQITHVSSTSARETRRTSAAAGVKQSRKEPASTSPVQHRKTKRQKHTREQQPPGAFGVPSDDDHDHDHHSDEEHEPEPVHATRGSSRRSTAAAASSTLQKRFSATVRAQAKEAASTSASPTKPIRTTRTRQVKRESVSAARRRVPGGLMDDDEDDDEDDHHDGEEQKEEEGEDTVPPLRRARAVVSPLTAPSSKRAVKKTRSIASEDAGSDDNITAGPSAGVRKSTRRSSRLSTAGSVRGVSPEGGEPSVKAATTTRKSGRPRKAKV
ncbi:hypothetical protein MD484_g7785, partial [Candolleomyces efflorescens]